MRVAVIGIPPSIEIFNEYKNSGGGGSDFQIVCLVKLPRMINFPSPIPNLKVIPLASALQMYREKKLDAFVITLAPDLPKLLKDLKLRGVERILFFEIFEDGINRYWIDRRKTFLHYLETNLIDACNLNCKACTHFAGLFRRDEVYPLDEFARDMESLAEAADIKKFRLLGGEPFLLKNLDEYVEITRRFLTQSRIKVVSNGLLIPNAESKIFESLRKNSISIDISEYPPTTQIKSQIIERLQREGIAYKFGSKIEQFHRVLDYDSKINNPALARKVCFNDNCRFLWRGKVYKCPVDALKFRFAEKFGLNYPAAMGVDVHARNLPQMLEMLDGNIDQCHFCAEQPSMIPWQPNSNPTAQDWIA